MAGQEEVLQRTEEWFRAREGRLTASAFGAAAGLAPTSRQEQWRRLTKRVAFNGNANTRHGERFEPVALRDYGRLTGADVTLVGFVPHPTEDWLGCSPDGLVGRDGLVEIKCPVVDLYHEVPPYYMAQVQGQLECTGRQWCDFVVWRPDVFSVQRIVRCAEYWRWLEPRLAEFWAYVMADVVPPRKKREFPDFPGLVETARYVAR